MVTEVIDLTVDVRDPSDAESLYAIEERVGTACRPIFKSAHRQWIFGDIPLYSQLETLVTTHRCRQTVNEARRWLDAYHIERGAPASIEPAKHPVIFSN